MYKFYIMTNSHCIWVSVGYGWHMLFQFEKNRIHARGIWFTILVSRLQIAIRKLYCFYTTLRKILITFVFSFIYISVWLFYDFQVYVGFTMPSPGNAPVDLPDTRLCYSHTENITENGATYGMMCNMAGSVVSLMLPGEQRIINMCEFKVIGG